MRPTADDVEEEKAEREEATAPQAEAPAPAPEEVAPEPAQEPARRSAQRSAQRSSQEVAAKAAPAEIPEEPAPADTGGEEEPEDGGDEPSTTGRPRRRRRRRSPRAAEAEETPVESEPFSEVEEEVRVQPSLETLLREIFLQVPDRHNSDVEERKIALFCDFENIALGVRDSESKKFEINLVLERLREKGKVIVKKAYSDWSRYGDYKKTFHEAGIELIEIPQKYYSGKNSADIKMVVDAMDLCYSNEHIDTFVVMSGDSDFSPLVSKLKENNKRVIGVGVKNASSSLLIDNCDEFIYYEDLWRDTQKAPQLDGISKKDAEAFNLLADAMQALVREDKEILWGSMIKQTMKRKRPSFNEGYYGYRTFSELLEDAERKGVIRLKKDRRSGSYIVVGFANSGR
jgi:uncharacterized protein (TIGR00288 family)